MELCICDNYEKERYIPLSLTTLALDFDLKEELSGPLHAEGIAKCKQCAQAFNWQYECFIHEKLILSKKKN
jgi:hypothetical protein